ncbi:MAG: MlaD family protein [Deltaproteobacteria bacterium]|jgi:phospholipid/cholesterol/gamma-HCH transport system substrate-binding protein|nr:MlaD family protein [Deltaproteobacteria bacterium]
MKLQYSTMERMTGAFILLTLIVFLFTVAVVGRGKNWFRKHVVYYTTFEEGYNLVSGSRVKLLGTDIGSVTDVSLTKDNKVKVQVKVLTEYSSRIRTNSVATVESPTVIGSEYINIRPGTSKAALIPPEGLIPSKEKKKFTEYLEQYEIGEKLEHLGKILEDLAQITDQLKDPKGPFFGTFSNLQEVTGTVEAGEGSLGRLIKSDELYEHMDAFVATLQETADKLVRAGASIEEGSAHLEKATREAPEMVDKTQELLDRLLKVQVILEKVMTEVPEISAQAREGMQEVNRILDSVKENFLIRPNLPPPPESETHGLEIRGSQN